MGLGNLGDSLSAWNVPGIRKSARYASGLVERRSLYIAATLVGPLVIAGYVGLAVVLCLPLLGLRGMLPRRWNRRARRDSIAGSGLARASA